MKILPIVVGICLILALAWAILLRARRGSESMRAMRRFRYAHRGLYDKAAGIPENSLSAFSRAVAHGFGVELDVHLLRDGSLAVFHDSDIRRMTGRAGYLEDLSAEELGDYPLDGTKETIPQFCDVLALFEDTAPLIIELKSANGNHYALTNAVCERLDSYKGEFCIESFDPFCVLDVKKLRPEICRGQLSMNFEKDKSGLPWYKRFIAGNLLPLRAVSALSVALYGMFLAIIIPPARKSRVVAALVAISFALSFVCNYLPGISALSEGTRTILLTVLISSAAAVLFPVNPEEQEAEHDA